eukprot:8721800-Pyramimonas_sp.AAC.1
MHNWMAFRLRRLQENTLITDCSRTYKRLSGPAQAGDLADRRRQGSGAIWRSLICPRARPPSGQVAAGA